MFRQGFSESIIFHTLRTDCHLRDNNLIKSLAILTAPERLGLTLATSCSAGSPSGFYFSYYSATPFSGGLVIRIRTSCLVYSRFWLLLASHCSYGGRENPERGRGSLKLTTLLVALMLTFRVHYSIYGSGRDITVAGAVIPMRGAPSWTCSEHGLLTRRCRTFG
jgi:hypothetical protein